MAVRLNVDGIMNREGAFDQFSEFVRTMMKDNAQTVAELGTRFPVFSGEDARRIVASTLLINGASSPKFFHAIVYELAKAIPKSEVIRISGSAHFPHVENSLEFNTKLREFLNRHS